MPTTSSIQFSNVVRACCLCMFSFSVEIFFLFSCFSHYTIFYATIIPVSKDVFSDGLVHFEICFFPSLSLPLSGLFHFFGPTASILLIEFNSQQFLLSAGLSLGRHLCFNNFESLQAQMQHNPLYSSLNWILQKPVVFFFTSVLRLAHCSPF